MEKPTQEDYSNWAKENPDTDIFLEFSGFKCKAIQADFYHSRERIYLSDGTKLEDVINTTKETT
jgi:hypothetical protein